MEGEDVRSSWCMQPSSHCQMCTVECPGTPIAWSVHRALRAAALCFASVWPRENPALDRSKQPALALGSSTFASLEEAVRGICMCETKSHHPCEQAPNPHFSSTWRTGVTWCFEASIQQALLVKLRHRGMLWP